MAETVSCRSCGRRYAVRPQYGGRPLECICGTMVDMPAMAGQAAAGGQGDAWEDLAGTAGTEPQSAAPVPVARERGRSGAGCPSCGAAMGAEAIVCQWCGYNRQTGARTGLPMAQSAAGPGSSTGGRSGKGAMNMLIGGGLVVVGLAVTIGTYMAAAETGGMYFLFWGPVIFGGMQFLKGLGQVMNGE